MRVIADRLGLRQRTGCAVDTTVNAPALDRVGRLRPLPLHPFEIGQPRAILKLVDHPCRNIRLIRAQGRRRERKLGLEVHSRNEITLEATGAIVHGDAPSEKYLTWEHI
jgi:hypothetical protein